MEFANYVLDVLGEFGAGRGDRANEYVHFGLPSVFFAALLWIAIKKRSENASARDALLVYGFGFGLLRELFMFVVKSLQIQGIVETATLELFFPPLEHSFLAVARVMIGGAFILFLLKSRKLTNWYLAIGSVAALLAYVTIAPFWWAEVVADPEIRFGKHWGDWIFHGHGLLASLIVIALLFASQNKSRFIWITPFFMFFLFDALMIYNLATAEIYKPILTPIRHNLHTWAIPLLGYVYLYEQEVAAAKLKTELHNSERLRAVGQLAAGVAHDFNNILQVIRSFAELADDSKETDHDSLSHVMAATDRAALLIGQLLLFSRKDRPQSGDTHIDQAIRGTVPMLDKLIGAGVTIESKLNADKCVVQMNESNFEQILANLVVNSVYAMPDGGHIKISTSIGENTVTSEKHLRLVIADTGTGMTSEQKERAFEPFYTTKPVGEGTGLGLATVFGIVTNYGGRVSIDSALGKGTAIIMELPISRVADDVAKVSTPDQGPNASDAQTILIAEDQPEIMISMTRSLEGAGYKVIQAPDGDSAISAVEKAEYLPDLCLFDISMPSMTGYALHDALVSRGINQPTVFMSGNFPQTGEVYAEFVHLNKPFTKAELLSTVRNALTVSETA